MRPLGEWFSSLFPPSTYCPFSYPLHSVAIRTHKTLCWKHRASFGLIDERSDAADTIDWATRGSFHEISYE